MKVIGAGFGRTGTTSPKAALNELGFGPCYHMSEAFEHAEHVKLWEAAWRGELVIWDGFLGSYEATLDWPACTFYEELMERHPDAKVLLSVRDPERWYERTRSTIYTLTRIITGSALSRASFSLVRLFVPGIDAIGRMSKEIMWEETFDGDFEDRRHAIKVFNRHNEEVKKRVPSEKLLVYEVKEVWAPLCEFLDVEELDKPFPHLNDSDEMRRNVRLLSALAVAIPADPALLAAGALILLRRRTRL